jgi:tetratricopeptide (TPR) repeat protein
MSKFQRRIADFILANVVPVLKPLDKSILQALAVFGTGMTTALLMRVDQIRKAGLDEVQMAIDRLSNLMLLVQDVDIIEPPPIVVAYFLDQARRRRDYLDTARQLANASWKECDEVLRRIDKIATEHRTIHNASYVQLTASLLRIAEPAHRLLLVTQQNDRAKQIPYRLQGHVREMVFVTYQQLRDYEACAEFASQWLRIEPRDAEIRLYLARSWRQLGDYRKATRLLDRLQHDQSMYIRARVCRERGMIAFAQGDMSQAIRHYRAGRLTRRDGGLYYPLINADLARTLITEADTQLIGDNEEKTERYAEAAALLEEARDFIPRFDQLHLDLYVSAQLSVGGISEAEALRLIEKALAVQGENPGLVFRAADILSTNHNRLDDALHYATLAHDLGDRRAPLTIAKIKLAQGEYDAALHVLSQYEPRTPLDHVARDVLHARALRDDPDQARAILKRHEHLENSFVACARVETEINAAEQALDIGDHAQASDCLGHAMSAIEAYSIQYDPRLFAGFKERINQLLTRLT